MTADEKPAPTAPDFARYWGMGWRRYLFPGFWLVYLGQTIQGVADYSHGVGAIVGYGVVGAFAFTYLAALPMGWNGAKHAFWYLYVAAFALTGVETLFSRQDALTFCVYLAVLTVAAFDERATIPVVLLAVVTAVLPRLIPFWHKTIDLGDGLTVFLVALAMLGFFTIVRSNIELSAARAEVARLAAENERTRIARDLHDLLGHSLTTITVKAGLARRLAETGDVERALHEITEVEQLSRRTLGDVRAAVAGHRDVTLAGELATTREVLRASLIESELPGSVDIVDPELSELFGWVLREAVTNVVRHAHATRVTITLGSRSIEIVDDGVGGSSNNGNGLTGLRERVAAAGGTLEAGPIGRGWRLRVDVPTDARPATPVEPAPDVQSHDAPITIVR